jgi:hypothetical protein
MFTVLGTKHMQKVRGQRSKIWARKSKCLTEWGVTTFPALLSLKEPLDTVKFKVMLFPRMFYMNVQRSHD